MSYSASRYCLIFVTALIALVPHILHSQNNPFGDIPTPYPALMYVGFMNADCIPDSVFGRLDYRLRWSPRYVCWGRLYDSAGNPLCDEGRYDSTISRSSRHDTTFFDFPDWRRFTCVLSVERFNRNDSLDDLILWMHGIDSLPGRGLVDTGAAVVVFGQSALETHDSLDLGQVNAFRSSPFFAMRLGRGRELINPKKRENLTGRTSWELVRVGKDVLGNDEESEDTTGGPSPEGLSSVAGETPPVARIWPNPAVYTTNVQVSPLPAGIYTVEVLAVNGEQVYRGAVTLSSEGDIFRTVDFEGLASGYYALRVYTTETLIGTWPIIVVR